MSRMRCHALSSMPRDKLRHLASGVSPCRHFAPQIVDVNAWVGTCLSADGPTREKHEVGLRYAMPSSGPFRFQNPQLF